MEFWKIQTNGVDDWVAKEEVLSFGKSFSFASLLDGLLRESGKNTSNLKFNSGALLSVKTKNDVSHNYHYQFTTTDNIDNQ